MSSSLRKLFRCNSKFDSATWSLCAVAALFSPCQSASLFEDLANTCQGRVPPTAVSSLIESGAEPPRSLMAPAYQRPDADQMLDDLKPAGRPERRQTRSNKSGPKRQKADIWTGEREREKKKPCLPQSVFPSVAPSSLISSFRGAFFSFSFFFANRLANIHFPCLRADVISLPPLAPLQLPPS